MLDLKVSKKFHAPENCPPMATDLSEVSSPQTTLCNVAYGIHLKGQCHEDFAVLGQFWAKIVTLRFYS